jgi:hypothetical protein
MVKSRLRDSLLASGSGSWIRTRNRATTSWSVFARAMFFMSKSDEHTTAIVDDGQASIAGSSTGNCILGSRLHPNILYSQLQRLIDDVASHLGSRDDRDCFGSSRNTCDGWIGLRAFDLFRRGMDRRGIATRSVEGTEDNISVLGAVGRRADNRE